MSQSSSTAAISHSRDLTVVGLANRPVPVRVVESGSGPPIVFLHGLVGLNEHWEAVVAGIQTQMHCTMLELPLLELEGDDCTVQGVAELTARFLSEHIIPRFGAPILVGNSFGGHVALRLALERPSMVRALILAGSSGLIEKSMVSDVQIRPSREWLRRKISELFFDQSKMVEADLDRAYSALSTRGAARAMVRLSRSARRNHLGEQLPTLKCPALLIWGRQDTVTPPEAAEGFLKLIPDSTLEWIDECGHVPMIEKPIEMAKSIRRFAKSLDGVVESDLRLDEIPSLQFWIDPGQASRATIQSLLHALNELHKAHGGLGLDFSVDKNGIRVMEGAEA